MNSVIIKSYVRSIQRGKRTLEQVPESLREAVAEAMGITAGETTEKTP